MSRCVSTNARRIPATEDRARQALEITTRWAKRCKDAFDPKKPLATSDQSLLYGHYPRSHLSRASSARARCSWWIWIFPATPWAGLSLGEPRSATLEMIQRSMEWLPDEKPRYLMGVGTPEDLWEAVALGIDQFDCVLPTRNGRNGQLFTSQGKLNMKNAPFQRRFFAARSRVRL